MDYAKFKKDVESIVSSSKEIMSYQSYIEEIGRETYLVVITLTIGSEASEGIRGKFLENLLAAGK